VTLASPAPRISFLARDCWVSSRPTSKRCINKDLFLQIEMQHLLGITLYFLVDKYCGADAASAAGLFFLPHFCNCGCLLAISLGGVSGLGLFSHWNKANAIMVYLFLLDRVSRLSKNCMTAPLHPHGIGTFHASQILPVVMWAKWPDRTLVVEKETAARSIQCRGA
jgi:hypothetical protein